MRFRKTEYVLYVAQDRDAPGSPVRGAGLRAYPRPGSRIWRIRLPPLRRFVTV